MLVKFGSIRHNDRGDPCYCQVQLVVCILVGVGACEHVCRCVKMIIINARERKPEFACTCWSQGCSSVSPYVYVSVRDIGLSRCEKGSIPVHVFVCVYICVCMRVHVCVC